ncbi:uncharacterized protein LACBIDRAFT_294334 [Laccaria bicolor S238N-H82]|uniref:Predicted protein n=1 Tax=Laccaria bicolor (strain S238N-H82 / ATCC MYA-4686) TaxID=486041 RepID=B0DBG6_LACBS|nr:uncharacterized protein LACBIDRAFT_294334 [Laccaria bicolor S238N-H82]EDR08183.1 predicted protein [Laccaria bicolor S238N-H82]|eukprot:XP_001881253.1 predicted protein [Laccaria bicolor S238N-H82]
MKGLGYSCSEDGDLEFRKLGSGTFGVVYLHTGLPGVVKKCRTINGCDTLRNEHNQLHSIHQALSASGNAILAPAPLEFYTIDSDFWEDITLPANDVSRTCAYGMSRVYAPPPALRKKIIDLFCPAHLRNNPSIKPSMIHVARILLGRAISNPGRVAPQRFFDTYNFPLTRDRVELLGIDVENTAVEMGRLLAQMHMKAKNDARDIEIVLGANVTDNSSKPDEPRIWVIDFNQVAPFNCTEEEIPRLVEAFYANEAYFPRPRPSDELYNLFSQAYIAECAKIDDVAVVLGRLFIHALEREQLARDQVN